jgi:Domain of unknown function (DUF397)
MMTRSARYAWRTSTYSNGSGGNCIEVADGEPHVRVRDSKDREGPVLTFSAAAWDAFVREVCNGEIRLQG